MDMQAPAPTTEPTSAVKALRRSYWMPAAVFILGVVSIAMLIWSIVINQNTRRNFARANSIMDLEIAVASFHLWFEEYLSGDASVDAVTVWADLDRGILLSERIVDGGPGEHDLVLEPLPDSELRGHVLKIQTLLYRIKEIALIRHADPVAGGTGTKLDDQFDEIYKEFMHQAGALENLVEIEQTRNQAKSERLFLGILFAWTLIVIAATAGLWSREKRRREDERTLLLQAAELRKHRFHLLELVGERTAELLASNTELQNEITGHKQTLLELEENKNKFEKLSLEFHTLLDAIPDALILVSPDLKILWSNRTAASVLGKEVPELTGQYCHQLRNAGSAPCPGCPVLKSLETGKTESAQITGADGIIWDTRAFPIRNGGGNASSVIEVAIDITEKLAMQEESMRMTHLASLGELAAGVAHEINNPINGIINCAQILIDESTEGNGTNVDNKIPSMIIKEGNRIATIVRSLLSFARAKKSEKMPVHLREILSNAFALLGKQLEKDGIVLRLDIPAELPLIIADPQQIEQVILNIVSNSRYALNVKYPKPNDGKILEIIGEPLMINQRPHVRITVLDKGTGVPAEIIDKLIDPFFSTKPHGSGTGLGLSISHGIVGDHGGKLAIKSIEGEYTKTQVILPAAV